MQFCPFQLPNQALFGNPCLINQKINGYCIQSFQQNSNQFGSSYHLNQYNHHTYNYFSKKTKNNLRDRERTDKALKELSEKYEIEVLNSKNFIGVASPYGINSHNSGHFIVKIIERVDPKFEIPRGINRGIRKCKIAEKNGVLTILSAKFFEEMIALTDSDFFSSFNFSVSPYVIAFDSHFQNIWKQYVSEIHEHQDEYYHLKNTLLFEDSEITDNLERFGFLDDFFSFDEFSFNHFCDSENCK